jgi:hypothetical protein
VDEMVFHVGVKDLAGEIECAGLGASAIEQRCGEGRH